MAKLKGLDQTITNLSRYSKRTVNNVVDSVEAVQSQVVNDAQTLVPKVTRALMTSIQAGRIVIRKFSVEGEVVALQEYASLVEGTTPSEIKRKITPYLGPALLDNIGFFRRSVARAMSK